MTEQEIKMTEQTMKHETAMRSLAGKVSDMALQNALLEAELAQSEKAREEVMKANRDIADIYRKLHDKCTELEERIKDSHAPSEPTPAEMATDSADEDTVEDHKTEVDEL